MSSSLYDRIGGEPAIMAAVGLFYERVLADELTRPFFDGLDMTAQTRKQVSFMTWAFDGPSDYRGRPLREAHAKLVEDKGLSDEHFDAVVGHLEATLRELDVADELVAEALRFIEATREEVLGRPPTG